MSASTAGGTTPDREAVLQLIASFAPYWCLTEPAALGMDPEAISAAEVRREANAVLDAIMDFCRFDGTMAEWDARNMQMALDDGVVL